VVAAVAVLGLLATLTLPPEPKGKSLEELTETPFPASAVALGVAESRATLAPAPEQGAFHGGTGLAPD
jgi:hypothetical protein